MKNNIQIHKYNKYDSYYKIKKICNEYNKYTDFVKIFEEFKDETKCYIMIAFLMEISKKGIISDDHIKFFKYLCEYKKMMGRKNMEVNLIKYTPFNNICWNIIHNSPEKHCQIINILHDMGFSIDTTNDKNEDAVRSLCNTTNEKDYAVNYLNVKNRMALFNALMTPTNNRLCSIVNEILGKSASNDESYLTKLKWCLLVEPYVTINQFIKYFYNIFNKNNKIEIYHEYTNYICKSISGINKLKQQQKFNTDIKSYISQGKSSYEIFIRQNLDSLKSEEELKQILFNMLVIEGHSKYSNDLVNNYLECELDKTEKYKQHLAIVKRMYNIIVDNNIIKLYSGDMDFLKSKYNDINKIQKETSKLEDQLDEYESGECDMTNEQVTNNENRITKNKEIVASLIETLNDFISKIIVTTYKIPDKYMQLINVNHKTFSLLSKEQSLEDFNDNFFKCSIDHLENEIKSLDNKINNIGKNIEGGKLDVINDFNKNFKINGYILMASLLTRSFFTNENEDIITKAFTELSSGTYDDLNIIEKCIKFFSQTKKYFVNALKNISELMYTEKDSQRKFKLMDILENSLNIKINDNTPKEFIINEISNIYVPKKQEPISYKNLCEKLSNTPQNNPLINIPQKNVKVVKPVYKNTKTRLCKYTGLGEKCPFGKKCNFSHRTN